MDEVKFNLLKLLKALHDYFGETSEERGLKVSIEEAYYELAGKDIYDKYPSSVINSISLEDEL